MLARTAYGVNVCVCVRCKVFAGVILWNRRISQRKWWNRRMREQQKTYESSTVDDDIAAMTTEQHHSCRLVWNWLFRSLGHRFPSTFPSIQGANVSTHKMPMSIFLYLISVYIHIGLDWRNECITFTRFDSNYVFITMEAFAVAIVPSYL